jgi:hypothetical protein
VKGGWASSPTLASSVENTIITECMQESGHLQSLCSIVRDNPLRYLQKWVFREGFTLQEIQFNAMAVRKIKNYHHMTLYLCISSWKLEEGKGGGSDGDLLCVCFV